MNTRILIVDDEKDICNSLSRRYRLKGFEVETAENGKDALAKMEEEYYHVVISDIKMPVMDGIDLLRAIRKDFPMTRVIMMTGYVTLENGLACLRRGADTVIFKPLTELTEMDQAVDKALAYLEHWQEKLLILKGMKDK